MSNNLRKRLKRRWPSDLTYTDKRVGNLYKQQSKKETEEEMTLKLDVDKERRTILHEWRSEKEI